MDAQAKYNLLEELKKFLNGLEKFKRHLENKDDISLLKKNIVSKLREELIRKTGALKPKIIDLVGDKQMVLFGTAYDIWSEAFNPVPYAPRQISALSFAIQIVNEAIGKLESDIEMGVIDKSQIVSTEPPKAFIAHEGETRALTMLKEFLEALEIQYFIAEVKASGGRSIERQVDWTQSQADFAICLATKGKAINKKTGKYYMAPNIADELGRARQVFRNKIILLVQKGVEVHTNVREIVHETFTTTNMEKTFIKILKELKNWGFLTTGKIKEKT